jgi:hypothetical protein
METGRAILEQSLAQARDGVDAEFPHRLGIVGEALGPSTLLRSPRGISTPAVSEKRTRRSKFVMGMMPGTIGSVTPKREHDSTKWKYASALQKDWVSAEVASASVLRLKQARSTSALRASGWNSGWAATSIWKWSPASLRTNATR